MARILRTSDGDVLDTLCYAAYGTLSGAVEAVYEANPGLAREPQPFRSGVLITLPDLGVPRDEPIQLWS
ncbi:tail protein X [Burkholderia pseudomallei]|uniref:tail protein X n=1 Tax=Burkholderia pseudomallei TaxID=28450 RepID=UPI00293C44EF|nr:phage Tail Protein X [Burkholderia pseudomallei]